MTPIVIHWIYLITSRLRTETVIAGALLHVFLTTAFLIVALWVFLNRY